MTVRNLSPAPIPDSRSKTPLEIRAKRKAVISIRAVVTTVALTTTTVAVIAVGVVMERNARNALTTEVETRLLLQTRNLAQASTATLLGEFPELTLHPLAKDMQARQAELGLVTIVDHKNTIQGHADSRLLGTEYNPDEDLVPKETSQNLAQGESLTMGGGLLMATAPVTYNGRTIGAVHLGLRREYIDDLITRSRAEATLILTGISALGVILTLIVVTILLKPIDALRSGLERIGHGDFDSPLSLHGPTELGVLAETVNNMAAALKTAQESMMEKERLEHELTLAREIQESLAPAKGIRSEEFHIEGAQTPAMEVGGDYYDYTLLPGGRIGMAVADVAGKGLAGCVIMSMLSVLLHAFKDSYTSPRELLCTLDEKLIGVLRPETFITMFYGILDPADGKLIYASAGHSPTLIYRHQTGQVDSQRTSGIPIGAIKGGVIRKTLKDYEVDLEPGDMLIQYTDGINEAFDTNRRQFGIERLCQAIASGASQGCEQVMKEVKYSLTKWQGTEDRSDDETLLVVSHTLEGTSLSTREDDEDTRDTALEDLARAQKRGEPLKLSTSLDELTRLREWLHTREETSGLEPTEFNTLHSALYEACANIVEHGLGEGGESTLTVWSFLHGSTPDSKQAAPAGPQPQPCPRFFILDQGEVFDPNHWSATDFNQGTARRKGRGFGLDIIHRAMVHVDYHPSTPAGNLTVLVFDPTRIDKERTLRYA